MFVIQSIKPSTVAEVSRTTGMYFAFKVLSNTLSKERVSPPRVTFISAEGVRITEFAPPEISAKEAGSKIAVGSMTSPSSLALTDI